MRHSKNISQLNVSPFMVSVDTSSSLGLLTSFFPSLLFSTPIAVLIFFSFLFPVLSLSCVFLLCFFVCSLLAVSALVNSLLFRFLCSLCVRVGLYLLLFPLFCFLAFSSLYFVSYACYVLLLPTSRFLHSLLSISSLLSRILSISKLSLCSLPSFYISASPLCLSSPASLFSYFPDSFPMLSAFLLPSSSIHVLSSFLLFPPFMCWLPFSYLCLSLVSSITSSHCSLVACLSLFWSYIFSCFTSFRFVIITFVFVLLCSPDHLHACSIPLLTLTHQLYFVSIS